MTRKWNVDVARILFLFYSRGVSNGGSDRVNTYRVARAWSQQMGVREGGSKSLKIGLRRTVFEIRPFFVFQKFSRPKGGAPGGRRDTTVYGNRYSKSLLSFAVVFDVLVPIEAEIFNSWRRVPEVTTPLEENKVFRHWKILPLAGHSQIHAVVDTLKFSRQLRT